MIWLTWRQHRGGALFALAGLAVLAALLVRTGIRMHDAFADAGLADCLNAAGLVRCDDAADKLYSEFSGFEPFVVLLMVAPLLVGLFFGAPVVARDIEQGTHRLLWTQGVTRRRWLLVKLGLVLAGTVAVAGAFAALAYWWYTPMALAHTGRFRYGLFDVQGLVPVGYTLFAVSWGILAGVLWRKVLPAMAATLVGFIVVRVVVQFVRPYFVPAEQRRVPVFGTDTFTGTSGDWILNTSINDASGRHVADGFIVCPSASVPDGACRGFDPGMYNLQTFHPVSQYWTFQLIETAIFVGLAALLLVLAMRQLRRVT